MARPRLRVEALRVRGRGTVSDRDRFARVLIDELAHRLQQAPFSAHIDRIQVRGVGDRGAGGAGVAARVADAILARSRR
jgi:hypothetical protein